ncbi:MAG: hypothetical protein K2K04_01760 [Clostridia bacterium]|nr:hypothetical protein [Clostridia bacterium]
MHEGHRNRLVSKVKDGGIVFEHELMEILLFNACPRKDVNATAHALVKRFDGIGGVLQAECADLEKVDGVGANMAEYIAVLGKALRAAGDSEGFAVVTNIRDFKKFILSRPAPEYDCLELYCLDKDGRVGRICVFKADAGLSQEPEETELLKTVSAHRPYGLFAAKRCACGNRHPDADDDKLSARVAKITRICGANLYDYCLVGADGGFYSYKMADRGVFADKGKGEGYGE